MNCTVEPALPGDAAALLPLLVAQYEEHQLDYCRERLQKAVAAVFERDDRGQFLVARHPAEGVVGLAYVSFAWPLEIADKVLWLEELSKLVRRRRAGVSG